MDTLLLRSFSISQRGKTRDEPKTASEKIKASDEPGLPGENRGQNVRETPTPSRILVFFVAVVFLSLSFSFSTTVLMGRAPNGRRYGTSQRRW